MVVPAPTINSQGSRSSTRPFSGFTTRSISALSEINIRKNTDMGQSLQDILSQPPIVHDMGFPNAWKQGTIRLYFQNVNGLRLQDSGLDITETFAQLRDIKADIFVIAETQLHCKSPSVQSILQSCKRRIWEHCKLVSCSSDEEWQSPRKPGGTLIGVTGPLAGRVSRSFTDNYGRWTRVDLLG
jgi:hypothetical protein